MKTIFSILIIFLIVACSENRPNDKEILIFDSETKSSTSSGDDTIVFVSKPEFMRSIFLDDNLLKDCECIDSIGQLTWNIDQIQKCSTFLTQSKDIYSSDSMFVTKEPLYKNLLSTYIKQNDVWIKKEFTLEKDIITTYIIHRNPERYFDRVDTIIIEEPFTGFYRTEVTTYYNMIKK